MDPTTLIEGKVIRYRNYGEVRQGEVVRLLKGGRQLHVRRLDGPLKGSIAWIHRDSIVEEEAS